ncbi:MAG: YfhO family protein, partial [Thermodesulfobacteriota bacterium]
SVWVFGPRPRKPSEAAAPEVSVPEAEAVDVQAPAAGAAEVIKVPEAPEAAAPEAPAAPPEEAGPPEAAEEAPGTMDAGAPAAETETTLPPEEGLEEPAAAFTQPPLPPLKNNARILDYSENTVTVEVDSESDTVLVLGDLFYPGWKVKVNGEKSRIIRVNGLVRGVPLKAGSSKVVFCYMPLGFIIGLVLMALSGIFCIILIYKDLKGEPSV